MYPLSIFRESEERNVDIIAQHASIRHSVAGVISGSLEAPDRTGLYFNDDFFRT